MACRFRNRRRPLYDICKQTGAYHSECLRGLPNTDGSKWIQFDATAAEVEDLLFAEFYVWEHVTGTYDISTEEYHVPTSIKEHIDYITPGTRLRQRNIKRGNVRPERAGPIDDQVSVRPLITQLPGFPYPNSSVCDVYVTAECTRGVSFRKLLTCPRLTLW